jgi:hypothetical protein
MVITTMIIVTTQTLFNLVQQLMNVSHLKTVLVSLHLYPFHVFAICIEIIHNKI